jgi:hypothetical protein
MVGVGVLVSRAGANPLDLSDLSGEGKFGDVKAFRLLPAAERNGAHLSCITLAFSPSLAPCSAEFTGRFQRARVIAPHQGPGGAISLFVSKSSSDHYTPLGGLARATGHTT